MQRTHATVIAISLAACAALSATHDVHGDQVVVRASGTVVGVGNGEAADSSAFAIPAPFNTVTAGNTWEVCIVYESNTPETPCVPCFNSRFWEGAVVSFTGHVGGIPFGPHLPATPSIRWASMSISAGIDVLVFRWSEPDSGPRTFEAYLELNADFLPGSVKSDIPTVLPAGFPAGTFDSAIFELSYGSSSDTDRARIAGASSPTNATFESLIDCNNNLVPDDCDISDGSSLDCNGNDIPDECELEDGSTYDCDCNGLIDECEIDADPSLDLDNNGFLDSCEECPDVDCDGFVWWPDAWQVVINYGETGVNKADVNFDGVVDFHDYIKVITHLGQFCGSTSGGWWWWWL